MSWITFEHCGKSKSGKTEIWRVRPKEQIATLGNITWYAPWRKYVFEPNQGTVFEEDCLREIADFCETLTKDHKRLLLEANS